MSKIRRSVGALPDAQQKSMQIDLQNLAEDFLTAALTTPLRIALGPDNFSLTERATWIERHLFNPANLLIEALSDENAPLRSGWPDLLDQVEPDRETLLRELNILKTYATYLVWNLKDRFEMRPAQSGSSTETIDEQAETKMRRGTSLTQEFKADLGLALQGVFERYFPNLTVSRGSYNKQIGEMSGRFPEFLRICSKAIFPQDPELSDYIIANIIKKPTDGEIKSE